jgi:hypothetical protein
MASLEPWSAVLKVEETHNLFLKLGEYALRECGGFLWPVLYGFLYWYGRGSLNTIGQTIFIVLGVPLVVISFLYPFVWRKYNKKREVAWKKFTDDIENLKQKFHISTPQEGDIVHRETLVKGIAEIYLWILIRRKGQKWYPQGMANVIDGRWEINVAFGSKGAPGVFELAAVVVDKQTSEELERCDLPPENWSRG